MFLKDNIPLPSEDCKEGKGITWVNNGISEECVGLWDYEDYKRNGYVSGRLCNDKRNKAIGRRKDND
jgi:hypothetical protein